METTNLISEIISNSKCCFCNKQLSFSKKQPPGLTIKSNNHIEYETFSYGTYCSIDLKTNEVKFNSCDKINNVMYVGFNMTCFNSKCSDHNLHISYNMKIDISNCKISEINENNISYRINDYLIKNNLVYNNSVLIHYKTRKDLYGTYDEIKEIVKVPLIKDYRNPKETCDKLVALSLFK